MSPKRLGTVLKELREKAGLTQEQLARRSGVSQGYIAKLEPSSRASQRKSVRKGNPSVAILKKLARALNVPPGKLLE